MDTKRLAAFKAVYEMGSMAKAANALFITPQGLSKAIAQLEAELGQPLFERTNRGVEPTAYATTIYPTACQMVELAGSIASAEGGSSLGVLNVATVGGGLAYLGRRFIREFEEAHPGLALRVQEGNDARVRELVSSGAVDCGFTAGPIDHEPFTATFFSRHPHCLVVRADDPLACKASVGFSAIEGRHLVIMGQGNAPYEYIPERLAREGVHPADVSGVVEINTAYFMLCEPGSDMVAITVDFALPPGSRNDLVALPFDDPSFTWDEYFITSNHRTPNPRASALCSYAVDWYGRNEVALFPWRSAEGPWRLNLRG